MILNPWLSSSPQSFLPLPTFLKFAIILSGFWRASNTIIHSGEGPICAVAWRGSLIAWANSVGMCEYEAKTSVPIIFSFSNQFSSSMLLLHSAFLVRGRSESE